MAFIAPDPSNLTYDPYLGAIRMSDSGGTGSPFIVQGTNGISYMRWETSGGYVYDLTIDDTGAAVTTLVSSPGSGPTTGNPFSPLWFQGITYS